MSKRPLLLVLGLAALGLLGFLVLRETPLPLHEGNRWNLLARTPDAVVDQPGRLVPEGDAPWGAHGPFGWEAETRTRWKARRIPYAFARQPVAALILPTGRAADRELRLVAWVVAPPDGRGTRHTEVRLNGIGLGALELDDEPREHTLPAPAEVWRRGANVLELEVEELADLSDGHQVGVALAEVVYDEPRTCEVDPHAGSVTLQGSTYVAYDVETLAPLDLLCRARGHGSGRLEVLCRRIDVASGTPGAVELALEVDLVNGEVERLLALPDVGPDVLRIELAWRGDLPRSELELEELTLVEKEAAPRPPVVFLSIDTLSARRMSLYGHGRRTTPRLDELAAESVVFEHCETNAPWTLPSYMSVMTGLYARSHILPPPPKGWTRQLFWESWHLAENRWTLAEMLRAAGYRTAGFVDNSWIVERHGFPQGFEVYDWSAAHESDWDPDGGIRWTTRLAEDWMAGLPPGTPFFLFVHGFDVHGPYAPPAPFRGSFAGDALARGREVLADGVTNAYGAVPHYVAEIVEGRGEPVPPRVDSGSISTAYDEGVLMVDEAVGRFLDHLRDVGLFDRSILIVHADHGETMDGSHYLFGHGVMEEEVTHVPLIVHLPGGEHGGLRVPRPVQSVDLYPTLMELVGIEPRRDYLHGRSLVPELEGQALPPAASLCETGLMRQSAVVLGDYKLVRYDPGAGSGEAVVLTHPDRDEALEAAREVDREWAGEVFARIDATGLTSALLDELSADPRFPALVRGLRRAYGERLRLYHLPTDPFEEHDLSESRPEVLARLLAALEEETGRREEAAARARPPTRPVEFAPADVERLEALGYVGDLGDPDDRNQ